MNFIRNTISYDNNELSYIHFGKGEEIVLVFHGFGQSAEEFYEFVKLLESDYKVYVFDHFFHGESKWNSNRNIHPSDLKNLFTLFFEQENVSKFQILAYSLGGKWAYSLFRQFSERITKMTLCASDGARTNFYYNFSTRNPLGIYLFKQTTFNPKFFYKTLILFWKIGLISKSLYRFVYYQMKEETQRMQVYNTWTKYRELYGLSKNTIELINERKVPVHFILGKYDKIIRPKWFEKYKFSIDNITISNVKGGHRSVLNYILKDFK